MSTFRRKFSVAWDGGEVVSVTTSARDLAAAQEFQGNQVDMTFALLRSALIRAGHDVPDLDEFIDTLDEMSADSGTPEADELDPTSAVASTNAP